MRQLHYFLTSKHSSAGEKNGYRENLVSVILRKTKFIPVPGKRRLKTKQMQATARGIWGTARRNMPSLTLFEFDPPAFIDGRLLEEMETWLRRGVRLPAWFGSGVNERGSSAIIWGDDMFIMEKIDQVRCEWSKWDLKERERETEHWTLQTSARCGFFVLTDIIHDWRKSG